MANAVAKKQSKPVLLNLYKLFKTEDDALHFHVNVDHEEAEPVSVTVHDTETAEEITLALDEEGVDEIVAILTKAKHALRQNALGVVQKSDPHEEYESEGGGEEEEEEEEEEGDDE
jgi:hypothetical protein